MRDVVRVEIDAFFYAIMHEGGHEAASCTQGFASWLLSRDTRACCDLASDLHTLDSWGCRRFR
jgi:hypothetical protein